MYPLNVVPTAVSTFWIPQGSESWLPKPMSYLGEIESIVPPSSSPSTSSNFSSSSKSTKSPPWTTIEKMFILRYKENAERPRKKGKKDQALCSCLAEKLNEDCKELGIFCNCTALKTKEKFFNLSKKYQQVNDQIHVSGERSEAIDDCPHFNAFDEFMGSRDVISPKHIL